MSTTKKQRRSKSREKRAKSKRNRHTGRINAAKSAVIRDGQLVRSEDGNTYTATEQVRELGQMKKITHTIVRLGKRGD